MTSRRVSLRRVSNLTLALTFGAAGLAAVTGYGEPLNVALGGGFMLGNFHLIRILVSLVVRAGSGQGARLWAGALLTLKFLLSVLLVAAVVYQFPVAPLSFAGGASTLLVAAVLEAAVLGEPLTPSADLEGSKS
jgi:hypothetical protein